MKEMPLGWLSPYGELWECEYYEHYATAEEICEKLNISYNRYNYWGKDDELYALGWCKLAIDSIGTKKYWVHWERPLTTYQRYFLKEYFEDENELKLPMDCTSLFKYFNEDKFFE